MTKGVYSTTQMAKELHEQRTEAVFKESEGGWPQVF